MITITTTTTLQAVLGGAPATTQPTYHVDYIDTSSDAVGQSAGSLNSTTDVDIVSAPSSEDRLVRQIHIHNADTASVTVTVKTDTSGTERKLIVMALTAGQSLIYNSASGWSVQTVNFSGAYQPLDGELTALAGLTSAADKLPYFTGSGTAAVADFTAAGRALVDDSDASAQRTTLGLGTAATQNIAAASGAWDFGGATSVEIPNGAGGATVDATGEICIDSTSGTLNFYDGTAERVLHPQWSKAFFLEAPVAADDLPIHRFDQAVTLTKVVYAISGGTNWVGQLQEADDAQGTSAADTQAADSTVTGNTTVTSFSNASFDAGDYVRLKTTSVSGSVTWLHVTLYYRINP